MSHPSAPLLLLLLFALSSCGSSAAGVRDPEVEKHFKEDRERTERERNMEKGLGQQIVNFDTVVERYVTCVQNSGNKRAEEEQEKFVRYLHDNGNKWIDLLLRELETSEYEFHRKVAASVLGFTGSPRVLNPLVNALRDREASVRSMAAFGLGVLAHPETPPKALVEAIEAPDSDEGTRANAAYAMFLLQRAGTDGLAMQGIWTRFLTGDPDKVEAGIAVNALRGLGLRRNPELVPIIKPYLAHRVALVRAAAAVAIGRSGDRTAAADVLALLGPSEDNPNVRLCARKALRELSGGIDHGDNVKEWRRVFGLKEGP